MEIAMVVAPMSQTNFKLAAQIGVSGVVGRYPGPRPEDMLWLRDRLVEHGLKLSVIEGYCKHGDIVRGGPHRDQEITGMRPPDQTHGGRPGPDSVLPLHAR